MDEGVLIVTGSHVMSKDSTQCFIDMKKYGLMLH